MPNARSSGYGSQPDRQALDFEAAKLRIAEILKRQDLIITADDSRHRAMDAASLLRPPPDQLDEQLPRAYLGSRPGWWCRSCG